MKGNSVIHFLSTLSRKKIRKRKEKQNKKKHEKKVQNGGIDKNKDWHKIAQPGEQVVFSGYLQRKCELASWDFFFLHSFHIESLGVVHLRTVKRRIKIINNFI